MQGEVAAQVEVQGEVAAQVEALPYLPLSFCVDLPFDLPLEIHFSLNPIKSTLLLRYASKKSL